MTEDTPRVCTDLLCLHKPVFCLVSVGERDESPRDYSIPQVRFKNHYRI